MFRTVSKLWSATFEPPLAGSVRRSHSEVKIPVPWGHIAGKWWNKNGNRPVIALHGWQDNANSFDRLVPLMSPEISVLALDMPGHGHSSHLPQGFPYHRLTVVSALRRIIEEFGWESVSLMGHSLGGQNSVVYAAMYPGEVDCLVLLDVVVPFPHNPKKFIRNGGKMIDQFLKRDSRTPESAPKYTYEQLIKMFSNIPMAALSEDVAKILIERGTMKTEDGKYKLTRDQKIKGMATAGWTEQEVLEMCLAVETNVLCIKAESSSYYVTKEFFDDCWSTIKKVAKSADLRYMPGCHHFHLENPDIIAPVVNDFFAAHYVK